MKTEDIERYRAETPGVGHRIHLNNAGAALMPAPVLAAAQAHLQLEAEIGGYEAAAQQRAEARRFYGAVGQLLNVPAQRVAWSGSATQAYNTALSALPWEKGDVLVTTADDYVSNQIAFLQLGRRYGVKVLRAGRLPGGGVDPAQVEELASKHKAKAVAVTHVPTNSGLVQDVVAVGQVCRALGVWYLVDACQSVGQMPVDAEEIGCDFLSATFRKFLRGPRGAGFLCVSDRALEAGLEPLFMDLHSASWEAADEYAARSSAARFETWERPHALVLAAACAAEYALAVGLEAIQQRCGELASRLRHELLSWPGVKVLDEGPSPCAIVTVALPNVAPGQIIPGLNQQGVNASVSYRSGAVIDFERKGVEWALRLSPHYYNTEAELYRALEVLQGLIEKG